MKLAAATALLSLALSGSAAAAPVELQGTMRFSTSTAGSVLVHFPQATRTFPDENGQGAIKFAFDGASLVRGVVLLAETAGPSGKRFAGYVNGSGSDAGEGEWAGKEIPSGDYRLYAIADGRPTTFAITMPSGGGDATLALADPAASDIHRMQQGGAGVFRASAATTGPGTMFAAAQATWATGQAGTVEFCEAVGQSADADSSYTLGCSQGDVLPGLGGSDYASILEGRRFDTAAAERHGFGGNAQSLTPPAIDGAVAALTFAPPGTPGGATSPIAGVGAAAAAILGTRARVTKTWRAPVRVRCAGPGSCRVRISVAGSSSKGKATIPAGAIRKVNVRLSSVLRKRLERARSVKATLVLQVSGATGTGTTVTRRRITFSAPRR